MIDDHTAIRVWEPRRVGHRKRLRPPAGPFDPPGAQNLDVIRFSFSGTVEPANEHVAVGALDDARTMVVPVLEWEDQLTP